MHIEPQHINAIFDDTLSQRELEQLLRHTGWSLAYNLLMICYVAMLIFNIACLIWSL